MHHRKRNRIERKEDDGSLPSLACPLEFEVPRQHVQDEPIPRGIWCYTLFPTIFRRAVRGSALVASPMPLQLGTDR